MSSKTEFKTSSENSLLKTALKCKCPRCHSGAMFKSGLSLEVAEQCPDCGLKLAENDSADGPAVFLIFILGFLLVPTAWVFELSFAPPLWVHGVLWGAVALALTLLALRPTKAFVIGLQFKHRPGDWD